MGRPHNHPGRYCYLFHKCRCAECAEANRVYMRAYGKARYHADPATAVAKVRAWQLANPDSVRATRRARFERNPEATLQKLKDWIEANPERVKEVGYNAARRRRSRLVAADGDLTAAVRDDVLAAWGDWCQRCGSTDHIQIDHIVPLSLGGSNDFDNLQPLCRTCNGWKGNRNDNDYRGCLTEALVAV